MRRPLDTRVVRDEAGFTVVELMVAMVVATIVGIAILGALDTFSSHAARQTRVTDANKMIRMTMDRVVADLRQARTIEVADANDLVYTVTDSATKTRRERICLDGAARVWRASVVTASPPSTPIAAGTACPTAGAGAKRIANYVSANSAANPLFRYDSAVAASVRSVGLTFALNANTSGQPQTSTLRAGTFVRAQSETALALPENPITTTCNSSTSVPTLTLAASAGPVTVQYTDIDGNALGSGAAGAGVTFASGTTTVIANITATTGLVSQLVKTIAC